MGSLETRTARHRAKVRALEKLRDQGRVSRIGRRWTKLTAALGGRVDVTSILLTAEDESVWHRLGLREVGSALDLHMQRSRDRAHELDVRSPASVHRISTDAKSAMRIAREILDIVSWTPDPRLDQAFAIERASKYCRIQTEEVTTSRTGGHAGARPAETSQARGRR